MMSVVLIICRVEGRVCKGTVHQKEVQGKEKTECCYGCCCETHCEEEEEDCQTDNKGRRRRDHSHWTDSEATFKQRHWPLDSSVWKTMDTLMSRTEKCIAKWESKAEK